MGKIAEDRVVLEQMSQGRRGGEVVYGYEFNLRVAESGTKDVASNAAEAVDAYLYCHDRGCSYRLTYALVRVESAAGRRTPHQNRS